MDILEIVEIVFFCLVSSFVTYVATNQRYKKYGTLKIFYTREEPKPIITAELAYNVEELAKRKEVSMDICVIDLDARSQEKQSL